MITLDQGRLTGVALEAVAQAGPANGFFPVGGRTSVATGLAALRSGELSSRLSAP